MFMIIDGYIDKVWEIYIGEYYIIWIKFINDVYWKKLDILVYNFNYMKLRNR